MSKPKYLQYDNMLEVAKRYCQISEENTMYLVLGLS